MPAAVGNASAVPFGDNGPPPFLWQPPLPSFACWCVLPVRLVLVSVPNA
jgi:hypothetical protein